MNLVFLIIASCSVALDRNTKVNGHANLYRSLIFLCSMLQDTKQWPLIAPLPSYGRGRELPGGRYMSFIHGDGLEDVIITGQYECGHFMEFSTHI